MSVVDDDSNVDEAAGRPRAGPRSADPDHRRDTERSDQVPASGSATDVAYAASASSSSRSADSDSKGDLGVHSDTAADATRDGAGCIERARVPCLHLTTRGWRFEMLPGVASRPFRNRVEAADAWRAWFGPGGPFVARRVAEAHGRDVRDAVA